MKISWRFTEHAWLGYLFSATLDFCDCTDTARACSLMGFLQGINNTWLCFAISWSSCYLILDAIKILAGW